MDDDDEKQYCYVDHANKKSEIYHSSPQLYRFLKKRKKLRDRADTDVTGGARDGADVDDDAPTRRVSD